jgi:ADP-heptose:LPS heptosyltransferase
MQAFGNILILHPAAIGDAMLASPVATTLKLNFPAAKITYWSHPELRDLLLGLCPAVDEYIDYIRDLPFPHLAKTFDKLNPDLFVDLAASTQSYAMTWFRRKVKVVRYKKQGYDAKIIQHATANFLETVQPFCPETPEFLFPTVYPKAIAETLMPQLFEKFSMPYKLMIGIVPGVGKGRPHRAWIRDGWLYLIRHILSWETYLPVLIGGTDEMELCKSINDELDGVCMNLAGELTLPQTAAVLYACDAVVSGDTGPAHLAVATGTKVVGLYGPTFPERSGPYGCHDWVIDQTRYCECLNLRKCQYSDGAGECMSRIMLPEVVDKLNLLLGRTPE